MGRIFFFYATDIHLYFCMSLVVTTLKKIGKIFSIEAEYNIFSNIIQFLIGVAVLTQRYKYLLNRSLFHRQPLYGFPSLAKKALYSIIIFYIFPFVIFLLSEQLSFCPRTRNNKINLACGRAYDFSSKLFIKVRETDNNSSIESKISMKIDRSRNLIVIVIITSSLKDLNKSSLIIGDNRP